MSKNALILLYKSNYTSKRGVGKLRPKMLFFFSPYVAEIYSPPIQVAAKKSNPKVSFKKYLSPLAPKLFAHKYNLSYNVTLTR